MDRMRYAISYTVLIGIIIVPLIYYLVTHFERKNKYNFIIGLSALSVAYIISFINTPSGEFGIATIGIMLMVPGFTLIYILAATYFKSDLKTYFAQVMMVMGLLVVAQTIVVESLGIVHTIGENKVVFGINDIGRAKYYGWTHQNGASQILLLSIVFTSYLACTSKKYNLIYFLLICLMGISILVTFSRGGILSFGLISIPLGVVLLRNLPRKRYFFVLASGLVVLFIPGLLDEIVEIITIEGTSSNGREELYISGILSFVEHPLLGTPYSFTDSSLNNFHNTFIHILATMGIVGAIAFMVHIGDIYKTVIKRIDLFMIFVILGLIGANIHGMVDQLYFKFFMMPILMFLFGVIDSSYEDEYA